MLTRATLLEPHDDHVKNWGEKQPKDRNAEHSKEYGRAERLPHFVACPTAEHEREDAEDKRERGHQDWPQAELRRFHRRGEAVDVVAVLNLFGEFHNEDRVLTGETDEHHEADLREDVVVHGPQP